MHRKPALLIVVLVMVPAVLSAAWSFTFDQWEGHPHIGATMVPTAARLGFSYPVLDNTTVSLLAGAGYHERMLWQHPLTGALLSANPLLYDYLGIDWTIGISHEYRPHRLSIAYRGFFEKPGDSIIEGQTLDSGTVLDYNDWFAAYGGNTFYKSLSSLGTKILIIYEYAGMDDQRTTTDGFHALLRTTFGPKLLNSNAAYISFEGQGMGALTLFHLPQEESNMYSIVGVERFQFSTTIGSNIPIDIQESTSLGSMVRGFSQTQDPLGTSVANQLELRFNGPEPFGSGFFPRFTLFCDLGYGFGTVYNTTYDRTAFLASCGTSVLFSLKGIWDLGYQMAYLISGTNPSYPTKTMVGTVFGQVRF